MKFFRNSAPRVIFVEDYDTGNDSFNRIMCYNRKGICLYGISKATYFRIRPEHEDLDYKDKVLEVKLFFDKNIYKIKLHPKFRSAWQAIMKTTLDSFPKR